MQEHTHDSQPTSRRRSTLRSTALILVVAVVSAAVSGVFGFIGGTLASDAQIRDTVLSHIGPARSFVGGMRNAPLPSGNGAGSAVQPAGDPVVDAVAKASPAVVSIVITKDVPKYEQRMVNPFGNDGFFGNFQVPQMVQNGTMRQQVGAGSGFIVSSDGYILTNNHVVADSAAEYTVTLADGRKFIARILATDDFHDIAVLKIDGDDFPHLTFSDSDGLRVGQRVIAIGYALGQFSNSVSTGVISGLSRSITAGGGGGSEDLYQVIQTDTAINPGNSGGPLLNVNGDVVGMNVAIVQGSQNIGFAILANDVKRAFETVKGGGKLTRPYLGVRYIMVNKDLVEKNQLPVDHGALVANGTNPGELAVAPSSPADKAGIQANDIILQINGKDITEEYPLAAAVANLRPGDTISLQILRKGEKQSISATLDEKK